MRNGKTGIVAAVVLAAASAALAAPNALPDLKDIRLDGHVGNRLRSCSENHVVTTDGGGL